MYDFVCTVAPQWLQEPQDVSTLVGNSIIVNCEAKGFPQPQIQWLKGQGKCVGTHGKSFS